MSIIPPLIVAALCYISVLWPSAGLTIAAVVLIVGAVPWLKKTRRKK